MTSTLFSFTVSRPLGWALLALMALTQITMLTVNLALHPSGYWAMIAYLGGLLVCAGVKEMIGSRLVKARREADREPMSAAKGSALYCIHLLYALFLSLVAFVPRRSSGSDLSLNGFLLAVISVSVATALLQLMKRGVTSDPSRPCVTLGDAARYMAAPLVTVALWGVVVWVQPTDTVSSGLLFTVIGAYTAVGLSLGFFLNRGQPRLVHGLAAVSILSAAAATLLPSAPGILTAVAVSAVSLSAGLARRSAFNLMLAALLLILPLLILLLGILAALLLTGHAP